MKFRILVLVILMIWASFLPEAFCETGEMSPKELIKKAWESWGVKDFEKTFYYTDICIKLYTEDAKKEQMSLSSPPSTEVMEKYEALNAVGTSFFIQGEAYFSQGKKTEAKNAFNTVIEKYGYSQSWDPRGWFWSVKEKSLKSLEKLADKKEETGDEKSRIVRKESLITLYDTGTEEVVNYKRYGYFKNVGTSQYKYVIKDPEGLSLAVGEGIYPNTSSVKFDPRYQRLKRRGKLKGSHWDFVNTDDLEANFYKWTQAAEPTGVKLFYTALALERSGLIKHAIKAYYAIVVHFPKAVGWTYFHTPWYIAQVAIDKIDYLLRKNPDLNIEIKGASIMVTKGFDESISNDEVLVYPGRLVKSDFFGDIKNNLFKNKRADTGKVIKQIGDGKVDLVQYRNGHWQLRVEGRPYMVKAIAYSPTTIGESPDEGTVKDWMKADYNKNGRIDVAYDSWVDKNRNNKKDRDEEAVGDFQLLKDMGTNTMRLYHHASNKELLQDLYTNYGMMVIMGDLLGAYTVGSGASWYEGTDYSNPVHRKNMLASVRKMVESFKDEDYILFWMLGNENNYGVANNAKKDPESYYRFVNEAARLVKSIDRDHPVAICNGDLFFLDKFGELTPDIDIYGSNAYRGETGFGRSFWDNVKNVCDKPVIITEFGCPAYMKGKSREVAEGRQAAYLKESWNDIAYNSAGYRGVGNSIGGVLFSWIDEWWKSYEPFAHDKGSNWAGPFPDGWNYEEWLGIVSQGNGRKSPFLRQLRPAYFVYRDLWNE